MGVDPEAPLEPASGLACFGEGGACPRERTARELQMPYICSRCVGASPTSARCIEEPEMRPECSDPEDSDEGVELDLDDEPRALLEFMNARRRRVSKSLFRMLPGFPTV